MPATYEPIATLTFNGTTSTGTFTSIPATFTDIRLVWIGTSAGSQAVAVQYNADTGTNYSQTIVQGNGSSATSFRNTSLNRIIINSSNTPISTASLDIFSYSGSTYKTGLRTESRDENGSGVVNRGAALWQNTAAITSLTLFGFSGVNLTGTATLYGILKA
jgi:hypothetical protein